MASKKNFKDNPIYNFITPPTEAEPEQTTPAPDHEGDSVPVGFILRPEPKTRRVQLLFQPSTYKSLKDFATAHNMSINEAVNQIIKDYLKER